ncbi:DUF1491 family protein [Sphingobium bisphenolivorans]|uniref:DUF1491 family protein n=1 Tax=Sphingobium bisphenolivorans TaxID=1335760 RepID=UPI00126A5AF3|nr:DUF1491 family protein [Sphingobium bisphenolivorans]
MLVGALLRRSAAEGGFAAILMKGDETSGVIIIQALEKGIEKGLLERIPDLSGGYRITRCGPAPDEGSDKAAQYIERRRRSDPDLWVIELDIADAERFAAETIC